MSGAVSVHLITGRHRSQQQARTAPPLSAYLSKCFLLLECRRASRCFFGRMPPYLATIMVSCCCSISIDCRGEGGVGIWREAQGPVAGGTWRACSRPPLR